jgi:hypothetical protein
MAKSGSGRKRRAVAETPVDLDAEGSFPSACFAMLTTHMTLLPPGQWPFSYVHHGLTAETLGDGGAAHNGGAQPSDRSSQPNSYFDEDDEELGTYENEV